MSGPFVIPSVANEAPERGRILLVDDDPDVLKALKDILTADRHDVASFSNPVEAREHFSKNLGSIDLIMCDYRMPQEDGFTLLESLLEEDDSVVGIIFTGESTTENAVRAIRAGIYDFLSKPFDMGTLQFVVKRGLRHRHLLLENRNYQRRLEGLVEIRSAALEQTLKQLEGAFKFTLEALVSMLEAREKSTGEHSERVAEITTILAETLGVDGEELVDIKTGAFLHDIGKVAIPDAILQKPGALDKKEWEIMKTHPEIGYSILSNNPRMAAAAEIVYSHHERFDGSGYPRGLKGEEIPRGARIFAVADAYDAIRFERPYSPARTAEETLREIRRCSGTYFDPEVVEVLEKCQDRIEELWSDREESSE
ncbi:MAG TPA: HD domain-containing phosphohydrolase [Opitutales bacterium]|nr:HD domain-containing phosphohydrolase [Opitutales bacterium]